jgi:hypothetical protein
MRKSIPLVAIILGACSTPAYRASEVPVPASYGAATVDAPTVRPTSVAVDPVAQPKEDVQ